MSAIERETSEYVEMSDSITLCIVKDGAAGTSINMKTGVSSPDALPSSGASVGDSYIIDGHLWTYTGGTASDATHHNGFTDCGKVSGEAGKNNYVHVAWSNKQPPLTKDDIVLSNTDGNAYAYMGTWVSETKEDTADEAVNMAKWVYVKGDKGEDGSAYDIYLSASVLKGDSTGKLNGNDTVSVTAKVVKITGGTAVQVTDTNEAYFTISRTDDRGDLINWPSGSFTVKTFEAFGQGVKTWDFHLYVGGTFLKTVTLPVVRDGQDGDGTSATMYTIEPCANFEATGKLTDASHVTVSIKGDVQVYKTVGDQKTLCGTGDGVYADYFRLSIGGTNYDGKNTFSYDGGNIKVSKTISYEVGKDTIPGSATISLYDLISGGTVGNQLASLVVPVSLNPSAIVDVNSKLGTIQNTTQSMQGTIETIKQGQGQISLKVQDLQSMAKSLNLISGGNVIGLYNKQYEVTRSSAFKMEQGKIYTVTARLWMESASNNHHVIILVLGADNSWFPFYYSDELTNTSGSVVRFSFAAETTKQMVVAVYEHNSSGADPGIGNYNGVHVDWMRVDEGDWTGTDADGRTLDAWTPSEEEIDALNLLPDPDFSEAIGYSDYMGERRCFDRLTGGSVSGMSKDNSTVDGCHGIKIEQSNSTGNTYDVLQYIVPFRGAGTYSVSCFIKDLHQTDASRPAWSENAPVSVECHPMDANKTRITTGLMLGAYVASNRLGDERISASYTFGDTAVRSGTSTSVRIAYLEVRAYLLKNGSVRVSRLCLSKSDHFIYWNANEVSEERKKDAAQLATGIDIDSKEITLTADNTKFRSNDGTELAVIDSDGLRATKIATTDTGHGHTVINGNSTVWFQKDGVTPGIAVFYDAAGVPHLVFYGTDGKQKYDIGPSGLQSLISSIQQAHSDVAYLRVATGYVHTNNSTPTGFDWLYVAKGQQADLRYIWRKQIPTTDASKNYDIYDGCVFTHNYYNTTNSVSWPNPNFLLPNGWYTEPNDGNLPMKLHMVDNEGVLDPTQTVYYQTFCYYEGGKVARTVRAYMKRTTSSQLVSKFTYAGSYDEI